MLAQVGDRLEPKAVFVTLLAVLIDPYSNIGEPAGNVVLSCLIVPIGVPKLHLIKAPVRFLGEKIAYGLSI